jgi:hypothetical protein
VAEANSTQTAYSTGLISIARSQSLRMVTILEGAYQLYSRSLITYFEQRKRIAQ